MATSPIHRAVEILRAGGLVAFPTETVYGLGADATNPAAVRRIFAAKGRPATNPLIAHVADRATARRYTTSWADAAETLAAAFWPGPLTLVLPRAVEVPDEVTAGLGTVGLRVPNHPLALELLSAFGGALAAPSANRSNHISPTTAQHVRDELGDAVDLVLDGGPCAVGIESTVLHLSTAPPRILRPGAVSRAQLEATIGPVVMGPAGAAGEAGPATSPGQQPVHYAPRTRTLRFESRHRPGIERAARRRGHEPLGFVFFGKAADPQTSADDQPAPRAIVRQMPADPSTYAQQLYATLRDLDEQFLTTIYVEMPPNTPEWAAVRDRLARAAKPV